MRKLAVPVTVTTLVAGVFGAFLRWLQLRTIYEEETGLTRPWAGVTVIFVIFVLAFAAALLCVVFFLLRGHAAKPLTAERALRASTAVPGVLIRLLGAAFAVGGFVLLFSGRNALSRLENVLETMFRAGCIVAGGCLFCLPLRGGGESRANAYPARPASVVLTLFFCVWLVYGYVINSRDPVSWNFLPGLLAVTVSTVAFYYICAYFFSKAKPCSAVFWSNFAALLNICTLFDPTDAATKVLHVATAGTLLLLGFLLLENMRETPAEPEVSG